MLKTSFILFVTLAITATSYGRQEFENTMSLADGALSPMAEISAISWLEGHWHGEAFGGITEEIWSEPLGGAMMGSFKLVVNGKVAFYELETISELNETLILQLKHFNADLTGWETKDETVDFKLVKITPNKVYFDGFTIERISKNEINMYVVIDDNGIKNEEKFNYKRVITD